MKLTRRQLRRLIESVVNESDDDIVSMLEMIRPLVRAIADDNFDEAERIVRQIGTDKVKLNQIDSVYRSRFNELANDYTMINALETLMGRSFGDAAEKGIAYAIFKSLRSQDPPEYDGIDTDASDYDKGIPAVYITATQKALKNYPGLLALFNANK